MSTQLKIKIGIVALFATFFSFVGVSLAAGAAAPDDGTLRDLGPILDAVKSGNGWLAAALAVVFATAFARRKLPDRMGGTFVRGDLGGMLCAFIIATAGAVGTAAAAQGFAGMNGKLAFTAFHVGVAAVGGFVVLHKLASALTSTKWWSNHAPMWLKLSVELVLKYVGSDAAEQAKAAGDAAVKAHPAPGMGSFTDVQ